MASVYDQRQARRTLWNVSDPTSDPTSKRVLLFQLWNTCFDGCQTWLTGWSTPSESSCISTAPAPTALASTSSVKGLLKSGAASTGAWQSSCFAAPNACWQSEDQLYGTLGIARFVKAWTTVELPGLQTKFFVRRPGNNLSYLKKALVHDEWLAPETVRWPQPLFWLGRPGRYLPVFLSRPLCLFQIHLWPDSRWGTRGRVA